MTSYRFCLPCVTDPWPLSKQSKRAKGTESPMGESVAKMTGEGNGTLRTPVTRRKAPERIHQTRNTGMCSS